MSRVLGMCHLHGVNPSLRLGPQQPPAGSTAHAAVRTAAGGRQAGRRHPRAPGALRTYGERVELRTADGGVVTGGMFDEQQVRAAAGITLALAATAFGYAALAKVYLPIRVVTVFFFVDFLLRVLVGLRSSPVGVVSALLTRGRPAEWVSAQPKRFAWTLGLVMAGAMSVITNLRVTGRLPMSICLVCLTLMWLEAVLGLCLGCVVHRLLVTRGWAAPAPGYEICADGSCTLPSARRTLVATPTSRAG